MPQPQRADGAPRIKTGSITREGAYDPDWGTQSEEWLTPSLRCNAIWFAGDSEYPEAPRRLLLSCGQSSG